MQTPSKLKKIAEYNLLSLICLFSFIPVSCSDKDTPLTAGEKAAVTLGRAENYARYSGSSLDSLSEKSIENILKRAHADLLLEKKASAENVFSNSHYLFYEQQILPMRVAGIVLRSHFKEKISEQPVRLYRTAHILLKFPENAREELISEKSRQAEQIIKEVTSEKLAFSEAAEKYSDHKLTAENGGDRGWLPLAGMTGPYRRSVEQLAAADKADITLQPVRTGYGLHIIRLLDEKEIVSSEFPAVLMSNPESSRPRNLKEAGITARMYLSRRNEELLREKMSEVLNSGPGSDKENFSYDEDLFRKYTAAEKFFSGRDAGSELNLKKFLFMKILAKKAEKLGLKKTEAYKNRLSHEKLLFKADTYREKIWAAQIEATPAEIEAEYQKMVAIMKSKGRQVESLKKVYDVVRKSVVRAKKKAFFRQQEKELLEADNFRIIRENFNF